MLNSTSLATDIKARLISNCGAIDDTPLSAFCSQIAAAIINHIKNNATVNLGITVQVTPSTGTGTTTGTGTIS